MIPLAPMSIPSPPLEWSSFAIGPFRFHVYALVIVAAIIIATIWTNRRMTKRGGEPWIVIDIVVPAVILGLLGARLYHVFTHPADYFYDGADFWRIFAIWEGGNAIIGGLIGGALGAWLGCRYRGVRFLSFADAVAPPLLLAQAIGRIGNWFNHELYGAPTDLPWGLEIESTNPAWPSGLPAGTLMHPTFLYELLWNVAGVLLLLALERMFRMRRGRTLAGYFIIYGLGRMWIESIRTDYSEIVLGLRSNVLGALIMVLIGVALLVWSLRGRDDEASVYADDHVWTPELDDAPENSSSAGNEPVTPVQDTDEDPDPDSADADPADEDSESEPVAESADTTASSKENA